MSPALSYVPYADHGGSGGDNNLAVAVSKFTPNVVCSGIVRGASRIVESCQGMVDRMYAEDIALTYAPRDIATPLEIPLPFIIEAPRYDSKMLQTVLNLLSSYFLTQAFGV